MDEFHSVSLRDFFQTQLSALNERLAVSSLDAKERVSKAEQALERRLDGLNEWRAQSADVSRNYATREMLGALIDRTGKLEQSNVRMEALGAALDRIAVLEKSSSKLAGVVAFLAATMPIAIFVVQYIASRHP